MKKLLTPLVFAMLLLAACGDNTTDVGTASGDGVDDSVTVEGDDGNDDSEIPEQLPVADDIDEPAVPEVDEDEVVISYADMVDPKLTTPTEVVLNPDDPTELWVRFVGGDPNCTAADAYVLVETPEEVSIELMTGITEDALTRSCLADEFTLRVDVELNEDATGKRITWSQPTGDEPQLVTPDITTDDFVGLTEGEAAAIADENIIPWRVVAIDGEFMIVTQDYNPGRLNFEVNDGVITAVTLG